jgi:hypothetical protein
VTRAGTTRDGENEAFVVDRYLESLLSRTPAAATDVAPELRATAAALGAGLPRYHPSFRFEESLARRLAEAAAAMAPAPEPAPEPAAEPVAGAVIPFPRPLVEPDALDGHSAAFRPAVIGGVLTSAALSLAGAAYVAWRRGRPAADPMARAIRAAARRRTA